MTRNDNNRRRRHHDRIDTQQHGKSNQIQVSKEQTTRNCAL